MKPSYYSILLVGILLLIPYLGKALPEDIADTDVRSNGCLESIDVKVKSVSCNAERDGQIEIGRVYGNDHPYRFSIDNQSFTTYPIFDRLSAGVYSLHVMGVSGCGWDTTVIVQEPDLLQVKLAASQYKVYPGEPVTLRALVAPEVATISDILWTPKSFFNNQDSLKQIVSISKTTTFKIEIRNENGCYATDEVTIDVIDADIFFPNIIKPGANQNGFFTVYSDKGISKVTDLRIYNRWGDLVFQNSNFPPNDPLNGWNGRFNGKTAASGMYIWTAVIEYLDNNSRQYTGELTLLRGGG